MGNPIDGGPSLLAGPGGTFLIPCATCAARVISVRFESGQFGPPASASPSELSTGLAAAPVRPMRIGERPGLRRPRPVRHRAPARRSGTAVSPPSRRGRPAGGHSSFPTRPAQTGQSLPVRMEGSQNSPPVSVGPSGPSAGFAAVPAWPAAPAWGWKGGKPCTRAAGSRWPTLARRRDAQIACMARTQHPKAPCAAGTSRGLTRRLEWAVFKT